MPGVDTKALLESHDRNIEALTRATEVATEGAAAVYRRQQEIMQAVANARELAEMSAKANQDAYEVMKKRLQTSIEEMKAVFAKQQG